MDQELSMIYQNIIRDMSEGVMTIRFNGIISSLNKAGAAILGKSIEDTVNKPFAKCFFKYEQNDSFTQVILDAVYDTVNTHEKIVPYYDGVMSKTIRLSSSFLQKDDKKIGIIVVFGDISELVELRDAVKAMNEIQNLNSKLEIRNKLLSETFGRYLSDDIVKQLLETPEGLLLGGEKQNLTIMMSDLRGFTAICERMEAQDLIFMLNHYLGEMTDIILRNKGTIIEFIGDGIMAIFGAPVHSDNAASEAVAAAVEMQKRMESVNAWNKAHNYPVLMMGIGINTGDVIVGNIGSVKRTKYGVAGSNVNLCGRIESYTVEGQILISPSTRKQISSNLEIAGEQEIYPKGVSIPITISLVTGIGEPYNVHCETYREPPVVLKNKAKISFMPISDKHCIESNLKGEIVSLSKSCAILSTNEDVEVFDNLLIDIGGKLYCKITEKRDTGYLVVFTSIPAEFELWYKETIK